jgi:hypothetical protein
MSLKATLNITSILLAALTALGSFATFTLHSIYENAQAQSEEFRQHKASTTSRIDKIEVMNDLHWDELQRELRRINEKLDKLSK